MSWVANKCDLRTRERLCLGVGLLFQQLLRHIRMSGDQILKVRATESVSVPRYEQYKFRLTHFRRWIELKSK